MAYNRVKKLEEQLRANNAANFITAIDGVASGDADTVVMSLSAFQDEPELLYTALAYAAVRGASVTFVPEAG